MIVNVVLKAKPALTRTPLDLAVRTPREVPDAIPLLANAALHQSYLYAIIPKQVKGIMVSLRWTHLPLHNLFELGAYKSAQLLIVRYGPVVLD